MAKHTYGVADPNGRKHIRKTERTYTHVVFYKPGIKRDLEIADEPWQVKQDRANHRHYTAIATGNDPYPRRCYRRDYPGKWTPAEIEEEHIAVERENAQRKADALATLNGVTEEGYITMRRQARFDEIEKRRRDGYYDSWQCVGWFGRPDLAEKAARLESARATVDDVAMVEVDQQPVESVTMERK